MDSLKHFGALLVFLCLLAGNGCQANRRSVLPIREASDCPDHFAVSAAASGLPAGSARSPMFDARDGTEIELVRSDRGWGDYQVPAGRYGVQKGELLRLESSTGWPLGIVRK